MEAGINNFMALFEEELKNDKESLLETVLAEYDEKAAAYLLKLRQNGRLYAAMQLFKFPYYPALYAACQTEDHGKIDQVLFQNARMQIASRCGLSSGADHSTNLNAALLALASQDFAMIDKILPQGAGLSKGKAPWNDMTNLLMAIWYGDAAMRKSCEDQADTMLHKKGAARDKALMTALYASLCGDVERLNSSLADLCAATQRVKDIFDENKFSKSLCLKAVGLYHLARYRLPAADAALLRMPEHACFWRGLVRWQVENADRPRSLFLCYNKPLDFMNEIVFQIPEVKLIREGKKMVTDANDFAEQITALMSK